MTDHTDNVLTRFEAPETAAAWAGSPLPNEKVEIRCMRVLLVDDEEPLRACLRIMLEFAGHQVTEAKNGAEGLKLFGMGDYDLVITDFEMPIMEGNTLATTIKSLNPSVPILMITASERARRDASNPVDALLNKPFTAAELHCAIQELGSARPEPVQPVIAQDIWDGRFASKCVGAST